MKIWFRIVICPSVIFFPDIFAMITLIHKQILAMGGGWGGGEGGSIMLAVLIFFSEKIS